MLRTGLQLRPGRYQVPRSTIRHWPLLAATVTAAAVIAAAFAFTGRAAPHQRLRVAAARPRHAAGRVTKTRMLASASVSPGPMGAMMHFAPRAHVQLARYVVRAGDSLSLIARHLYGQASEWPALWWVNRSHVHNPAALKVGTVLDLSLPAHPHEARLLKAALAAIPRPVVRRGAAPTASTGQGTTAPAPVVAAPMGSLQSYAQQIFGSQYSCAASIIERESGWQVTISNPTSGAYGIPQALPGSKMASAGADWATNGDTQLLWMKGYVDSVYGGACAAWSHWQSAGSY